MNEGVTRVEVLGLVQEWAERLQVNVGRVRFQRMRKKWGSISTAGNLTLAVDVVDLPGALIEYVVCHELLHLRVPCHNRLYHLQLSCHLPDWRERERELAGWTMRCQGG